MQDEDGWTHARIGSNGITLHVVQAGPEDGPLVLLLHGFPEYWRSFAGQMGALAAAGYRVWAPDQRGYNTSDKPRDVAAYHIDELAKDVVGLIEAAGRERALAVIGHDWGAAVAWWVALHHSQSMQKLGILNVPHPAVFQRHIRSSFSQMRKSWYMLFFQIPRLPESMLRANDWRGALALLRNSSHPDTFSPEEIAGLREAWSQPGAFSAMLNWYRAFFRHAPSLPDDIRVHLPTLMIWGARDIALGREMAQPSIDLCDDGRLVVFEDATHWVQHDETEPVSRLLLEFLAA